MKKIKIEKIQRPEIGEVAGLLAGSFITNPAYSMIFKKKEHLEEGLQWVFKASLLINNHKQVLTRVIKEKGTGKIIGTFTLIPPGGVKSGISVYSKIGLPRFVLKFGAGALSRMLELDKCNKSGLEKSIKTPEYYYLSMVVVDEAYRGGGIGSYAVKRAIEELISSKPGCNLMGLTTQLPENVTFYSKLGFEKLDEGYVNYKGDKYYNYNMKLDM